MNHMCEQFSIRDATLGDIDHIVRMRLSLQQHMSNRNPNLWQMSEKKVSDLPTFYRTAIEAPQSLLLVVHDSQSGMAIGTGLGRICTQEEYTPSLSGRIDDVWIEPDFRRRGLGRRIVARLVEFFDASDVEVLALDYSTGNTEAAAMWQALGFRSALKIATTTISSLKLQLDKR